MFNKTSLRVALGASLVSLFAITAACHRDAPAVGGAAGNDAVMARLDKIEQRLEAIEKRPAGPAAAAPRPRLDPSVTYAVQVASDDVWVGPADAKVTIVEAHEFACPYCQMLAPVLEQVATKYPKDVRIVSQQYVVHPQIATLPALALCAAGKQGKGPEFSKALWASAWTVENERPKLDQAKLQRPALEALAKTIGLDLAKFGAELDGQACKDRLQKGQTALATLGVTGTPALFINGKPYQGPRTPEAIGARVDEEIKRADGMIASGVAPGEIYGAMIKDGKKQP